ncbi:tryptophan synthase subunit alpha [Candidatus Halobeggiatoa sp. HSG11]|nr:tryptophan synthase subunit alpha [Candidatus Halobeggiatoa sp. HSG11]
MSRLRNCFKKLKNRTALIPFITAGDPTPELTVPLMHALVEAGANIIELGIPFSDPMADGPVIQRASERALGQGMTLVKVLQMVKEFRIKDNDTPVVLMGYLNPIEIMGYKKFAQEAENAEVDGILRVDFPPEEITTESRTFIRANAMSPIFLLSPTTTPERIKYICSKANGYVYYVAVKGVTGSADLDIDSLTDKMAEIRKYTKLPIGVGFGIKDAKSAAKVAKVSDAVIVGSALVGLIETTPQEQLLEKMPAFLKEIRLAMDS